MLVVTRVKDSWTDIMNTVVTLELAANNNSNNYQTSMWACSNHHKILRTKWSLRKLSNLSFKIQNNNRYTQKHQITPIRWHQNNWNSKSNNNSSRLSNTLLSLVIIRNSRTSCNVEVNENDKESIKVWLSDFILWLVTDLIRIKTRILQYLQVIFLINFNPNH